MSIKKENVADNIAKQANTVFNIETIERSRTKLNEAVIKQTGKLESTQPDKDNQDESNMESPETTPGTVEASDSIDDMESAKAEFKSLEAAVGNLLVGREVGNSNDKSPKSTPNKKKAPKRELTPKPNAVPAPPKVEILSIKPNPVFKNALAVERELIEMRKRRYRLPREVVEDWREDRKCNGREEAWSNAQPDQVLALVRICINICDVRSECMKDDRKLGGQSGIVAGHNLVQRLDYYDSIKKEDKSTIDALDSFKPGTAVNL